MVNGCFCVVARSILGCDRCGRLVARVWLSAFSRGAQLVIASPWGGQSHEWLMVVFVLSHVPFWVVNVVVVL